MVNKNMLASEFSDSEIIDSSIFQPSICHLESDVDSYQITVANPVKNGDIIQFSLLTSRECVDGLKNYDVTRIYEDFKWLHYCLITNNTINGIIIPPLPKKPILEAKGAEIKAKKHLGNASKELMSDDFHKDCYFLQRYLKHMLEHWKFQSDNQIHTFLSSPVAPPHAMVKQSLIERITSSVDESKKSNHRDIDDYFQMQRDWTSKYYMQVKASNEQFNRIISSQKKIASSYGNIATVAACLSNLKEDNHEKFQWLTMNISDSIDNVKHGQEVSYTNDEKSLGYELDQCTQYADSLKSMHNRRVGLLIQYEESNRSLSKAKPHKISEAEEHKRKVEKELEECTEIARKEIQLFHNQRLSNLRDSLAKYTEAKIKTAKDIHIILSKSVSALAQI